MSHDSCANEKNGWRFTPLKAEVTLRNGKPYNSQDWKTEGYPIIRIQNLKNPQAGFNYFQGDLETEVQIRSGDLVFSWSGSKGTSFGPHIWRGELGVLNQHIFKVEMKPNSQLLQDFLYYALRFLTAEIEDKAYGLAALVHDRKSDLESTPIPLPPLPEQKKIAHILSSVQRAIEAQEQIIQTTTELKQALMQKLFSEGLRGEPQKETEIGLVPESWEVKPLIDTVEFIDYGVSQAIPKTPTPEGVKIVSTADIDRQGNLLYRNIRRIIVPAKTAKRLVLKDGDVLFNWRNSAELIGKTTIYAEQEEQHIFASFILRICTAERYSHNHFLKHLMNHYRKEGVFVKLARRAVNQANYNRNEISILRVPIPPYEEQVEIAKAIGSVEAKTRSHINKKLGLEALFSNLLHELMTAKTRIHELELPKTAS